MQEITAFLLDLVKAQITNVDIGESVINLMQRIAGLCIHNLCWNFIFFPRFSSFKKIFLIVILAWNVDLMCVASVKNLILLLKTSFPNSSKV